MLELYWTSRKEVTSAWIAATLLQFCSVASSWFDSLAAVASTSPVITSTILFSAFSTLAIGLLSIRRVFTNSKSNKNDCVVVAGPRVMDTTPPTTIIHQPTYNIFVNAADRGAAQSMMRDFFAGRQFIDGGEDVEFVELESEAEEEEGDEEAGE